LICSDELTSIPGLKLGGKNIFEARSVLLGDSPEPLWNFRESSDAESSDAESSDAESSDAESSDAESSDDIQVVGICGKKGAGKSTAALHLSLLHKDSFVEMAFADPLKDISRGLFLFSEEQLYSPELKENVDERWGTTPRRILQVLGTEVFRDLLLTRLPTLNTGAGTVSTRNMEFRIRDSGAKRVCVSDVRFPDEAHFIRSFPSGVLLRVVRFVGDPPGTSGEHSSETSMDSVTVDFTVMNRSDIPHLQSQINTVLTAIK
jgi:energy-coupling factor transporter ATP-binding protein EcfA2